MQRWGVIQLREGERGRPEGALAGDDLAPEFKVCHKAVQGVLEGGWRVAFEKKVPEPCRTVADNRRREKGRERLSGSCGGDVP